MKTASRSLRNDTAILPNPRDLAHAALAAAIRLQKKTATHGVPGGTPLVQVLVRLLALRAAHRNLDAALLLDNAAPAILDAFAAVPRARKRGGGRETPPRRVPTTPLDVLDTVLMKEVAGMRLGRGLDEIAIAGILIATLVIEHGSQEAKARYADTAKLLRAEASRCALRQTA